MSTPTTRRTDRKREEILAAAARVFQEEGYEVASMDRIAEAAGASKRTVYNHFGSKEALFDAVVEEQLATMLAQKRIAFEVGRPLTAQLADFARAKSLSGADEGALALYRVILGVFVRDPARARDVMERASAGEDALARWLAEAHTAGALAVEAPRAAADLFWGMASGMLFWPQLLEAPLSEAERSRRIAELVETFLCRFRPTRAGAR